MLTSTPEFKAVLRMLHDSGREVTPDELLAVIDGAWGEFEEFLETHAPERAITILMQIRLRRAESK